MTIKYEPYKLIDTCDDIYRNTASICETYHGSAWLYCKLCRYFESEASAVAVTIPVTTRTGQLAEAIIYRDGNYAINAVE